jgi:hypothetical protein
MSCSETRALGKRDCTDGKIFPGQATVLTCSLAWGN